MNNKIKATKSRRRNNLGNSSYEKIVSVAESVLKQNGFHCFSTRNVANKCGISVGNLTYYFPNKVNLIEAVMKAVCKRYSNQRLIDRDSTIKNGEDYLNVVITWMLDDAVTSETSSLFLELWVMAKHHDFGVEIIENFYASVIKWITASLGYYYRNISKKKLESAAYFILTLSEGTLAVFSRSYQRPVNHQKIIEFALNGVLSILDENRKNIVI